ncbi:MAG: hypothetical protein M1818_005797 [Claussenomyces sp. TS43310]|nr:MAG: hypothetical protein M1818_005797 [Claussenomyces sp. TS43310]
MNTTTAYTPLESLLLFQSLATYGTEPDVFSRTSDLMKNNALIVTAESYDPGRLSPDALRELYVHLLREELKNEVLQVDVHGNASPSKKRKLQSPPPVNLKNANEYNEKLPQLVDRLYARYRVGMIRAIREDERRYALLQREIEEIERGEWDERILKDGRRLSKRSASLTVEQAERSVPPEDTLPSTADASQPPDAAPDDALPQSKPSAPSPQPHRVENKPDSLAINDVINARESVPASPQAPLPESTQHIGSGPQSQVPSAHPRSASKEPSQGPSSPHSQQRPAENVKREQSVVGGPQMQYPPICPPNASYPQFPPPPYSQYPQAPPRGSFSGPHGLPHPVPVPSSPLNPAHPHGVVLPAPGISRRTSGSPAGPLDALADAAGQQYRPAPVSPLAQQGNLPGPGYGQPYAPSPQYRPDGRSLPASAPPQQWNQQYMPPYPPPPPPGYNHLQQPLPPQRPLPPRPDVIQAEQRQYNSPYNPSQGPRPILADQSKSGPSLSTPRPRLRDSGIPPHTPASLGRQPFSTGKATRWTPKASDGTPKVPKSPQPPSFEPLSPVLQPARMLATKKPKVAEKAKTHAAPASAPQTKSKRARSPITGSTASSAVAGSHRSQSVMSLADELLLDNEAMSSQKVKQESSTPRLIDETGGDTTADEGVSRRRRDQLRDMVSPRRVPKRKRQETPSKEPSVPPTHVLWTRNFPKISASALERIGAHRTANTFALPIKERDAPGYKNVILRPQDLKSIRMAVAAGNKAGAAVAATMDDHGQTNMMLPISEDLVPPRGIVNNAQLEKELMRIFANAVMFNPDPNRGFGTAFEVEAPVAEESAAAAGGGGGAGGSSMDKYDFDEDGVVKDTRAMFADVEEIVGEMRSAERRRSEDMGEVEEDEVDELAGDGEHGGGAVKRRRRA